MFIGLYTIRHASQCVCLIHVFMSRSKNFPLSVWALSWRVWRKQNLHLRKAAYGLRVRVSSICSA